MDAARMRLRACADSGPRLKTPDAAEFEQTGGLLHSSDGV